MTEITEASLGLEGGLNRGWLELGVVHPLKEFKSLFNPLKHSVRPEVIKNFAFVPYSVFI